MYKFSGWMLRTAALFDRSTVQDWLGAQVRATKYFLGLAPDTKGQVVGCLECATDQLLLVVEWEVKDKAARRVDMFSQAEAERYLQRVPPDIKEKRT